LILLPFTTILSVWTREKLGISGFAFYKEALILIMFLSIAWYHVRGRLEIKWSWIDGLILAYIITMIGVSLFTTGIPGIIYGGRYDFAFLLAFWIIYHGAPLIEKPTSYYLRIFLISSGLMLFCSALLKWPLSEDLLLTFGYCGNPSNWQACDGVPPIFHGIDGANVRRFQWLLDGPNTMGAFLILFAGIFVYYTRMRREWYFVIGLIVTGLFMMIVYTYSRSALLGALAGIGIAVLFSIRSLYRKYRKEFLTIIIIWLLGVWVLAVKFAGSAGAIIGRAGSTQGHFERMMTSIDRFKAHPMGQWLASSGPAYRYVVPDVDASNMIEKDRFYIPESWYIQQFVEWGVIWGVLFLAIMLSFFWMLIVKSPILGGMFAGIGVMNLFLHTFESSVLVLSLFMLIGLFLAEKKQKDNSY
jgi:O-Antigen ligase